MASGVKVSMWPKVGVFIVHDTSKRVAWDLRNQRLVIITPTASGGMRIRGSVV